MTEDGGNANEYIVRPRSQRLKCANSCGKEQAKRIPKDGESSRESHFLSLCKSSFIKRCLSSFEAIILIGQCTINVEEHKAWEGWLVGWCRQRLSWCNIGLLKGQTKMLQLRLAVALPGPIVLDSELYYLRLSRPVYCSLAFELRLVPELLQGWSCALPRSHLPHLTLLPSPYQQSGVLPSTAAGSRMCWTSYLAVLYN